MGDIALRGNKLTRGRGPHGHASQPHLSTHAKGGRAGKFGGGRTNLLEQLGRVEAEPSNPNRRAEISRVHGELNRGYAIGGAVKKAIQGGKKIISKIKGKGEKGLGSGIKPSEMHEIIPKKDRKLYLKEKLANPHKRIGKAAGGWTKHIPERLGPRGGHPGFTKESMHERWGGGEKGKPHSSKEGRIAAGERNMRRQRERVKELLKRRKAGPQAPSRPPPKYGPGPYKPGQPRKFGPGPYKPGQSRNYQPAATGGRIGLKKGGSDKNWIQKVNKSIKKRGTKGKCTPITKPGCTGRAKALAKTFKKMAAKRKA